MHIKMSMHDPESGRYLETSQDVEYLGDVAEIFLSFLQGVGYNYVKQVVVIKDDGVEVATVR
jgi:hypothetical protein